MILLGSRHVCAGSQVQCCSTRRERKEFDVKEKKKEKKKKTLKKKSRGRNRKDCGGRSLDIFHEDCIGSVS